MISTILANHLQNHVILAVRRGLTDDQAAADAVAALEQLCPVLTDELREQATRMYRAGAAVVRAALLVDGARKEGQA